MPANSTEPSEPATRRPHPLALSILISLIAAGGTLGGFLIGRHTGRDAYVEKVGNLLAIENKGVSLYDVLGRGVDDPVTAQALAKVYGVAPGDRDALAKRLRSVIWSPPYRPAPFVGHMARPMLGDDPHINVLGFRDERQGYAAKPERTVRVFLTGGSTAWGTGASSQKMTISYQLEQILNQRVGPATGYRYEVINTALPAWSTTQERILIQQRLVDLHPDLILMFSGTNDIHWTHNGQDIRWFYTYHDQNYMTLLNELYKSSGHPEWGFNLPANSQPADCRRLAAITARNVTDAAATVDRAKARLIFAFQPTVTSTAKRLSKHEQLLPEMQNKTFWDACQQALRDELGKISLGNYRFLDLSRSFGEVDDNTELFVDSYHLADRGDRLIAQALADQIDWRMIVPGPGVLPGAELKITKLDPIESTGSFTKQPDGSTLLHIVPNRFNGNLLVIFDQSVLPTIVGSNELQVSVPGGLSDAKGEHKVYLVDAMTGETSLPVAFQTR